MVMATEQGTLVKIMRVDPSVKLKINEEEQDMAGEVLRWSKRCFDPFEDARHTFDVRFYLVAILFIIFDLEAMFMFPWCISLSHLTSMGFWTMIDFLLELAIGFIYAWRIGALEWE